MRKHLILVLALVLAASFIGAAYAEVQNVKVSGDITLQGISRNNIMLRKHNRTVEGVATEVKYTEFDRSIGATLSQVRLRVDADLTDNVATTVRLLNERVWDAEGTVNTDIDLDLAYVTLKEFLYSPLSLTLGRQELHYGNGLIIGDVDTNGIAAGHGLAAGTAGTILPKSIDDLSIRKAFDAVKATLNYDPLVIDAAYAKVTEGAIDIKNDVNLMGVNATYAADKNTTLEGYFWEKNRIKAGATTATGQQTLNDVTRTIGTRVQYTGIENLTLGVEGAYQFGKHLRNTTLYPDEASNDQGSRKRSAYAAQFVSSYNLAKIIDKYSPVVGVNYTFLSGDAYLSTDKVYHGWDPMYENQAGGTLFNKILGYSNAQLINVNASVKPKEDVKLALDYYYLRLLKPYRVVGSSDPSAVTLSGVLGDPTFAMKAGEKSLGSEIDLGLTYDYTEDVQLGLSAGWFFPGDAFASTNDRTASQVIGSMKVTF